jgi:hypothetical protein
MKGQARIATCVLAALLAAGIFAAGATAAPVAVRATFDTPTVQFGDPIRTHVVVVLDATRVRSGSLRIADDLGPLTSVSEGETTRTAQGRTLTVAVTRTFSCLSSACVAANGDATPALPRVTASVLTRDGETLRATSAWPTLHVRGRVSRADLARSRPPFRADTSPPPPSYRLAPGTLAWLLDGLAIALALGAVALAAYEVRRLAGRGRAQPTADELERALRFARESEDRPPPDRRRALGLLARVLGARDRPLSGPASDLAWSKPEPEREALATLVADVEREAPS